MNITPFEFESNTVRTITDEHGEPWFVLRDVLKAMDRKGTRTNEAKASIEEGLGDGYVKTVPILDSMERTQDATIISEPAVTYLVSRSNTETGKRLNRWIHSEVLPSIRKKGFYGMPKLKNPQLAAHVETLMQIDALQQQQAEHERRLNQIETANDHFTIIGYMSHIAGQSIPLKMAASLGKKAKALCKERGVETGIVPDPRFGRVATYPKWLLDEVCTQQESA